MIGGWVIEVAKLPDEARDSRATHRIWVVNGHDELAVHVHNDRAVRLPRLGEELWWQAGRVYFGGPDPKHGEVSMRKVGHSYDPRNVIKRCPE